MAPLNLIRADLLLLLLFLLSAEFCFSKEARNPEVIVLIGLRQSLNDPRGVLRNWDETSADPCSWTMITCSSEKLVIALGAPSQSLSGSLSGLIGNLTNIRQVLLQNNDISGKIPSEIGALAKLQTLDLSNNNLSGILPHSIGLLSSLQYLRLNNNTLSGFIPTSVAKIPQLAFVDLSFNNLTPPVPHFAARTFNVMGNPAICDANVTEACSAIISAPYYSNTKSGRNSNGSKVAIAIGISLSAACLLVLAVGLFHLWQRQQQKKQFILNITDKQEEELISFGNLKMFTIRELHVATNGFSQKNLIGSGGFGNVYKGNLGEGVIIAVKRLKDFGGASGESQFRTELEMISLAVHRHLLRVIGYCVTCTERILVYPYMANGSVASRLREKPALEWDTRKRIAIGAARGLLYLHEQCDPKIIHRDVKAANVLLDDYDEAVVGDFGLAKLLDHSQSHVTTTVRGTVGHIAPEYLSTGCSSDKTDVFGFGILLLELLTGMQAPKSGQKGGAMLDRARKIQEEKKVELLVDTDLGTNYDRMEATEMLQVALVCTQYQPGRRPKMSEVVRMLAGDGLVEKWEANVRGAKNTHGFGDLDRNLACMDDEEYDDQSLESYAMELSGPR